MKTHYTWTNDFTGEQLAHKIVPKQERGASKKPRFRVICLDSTGSLWLIDEHMYQSEIERQCPTFFGKTHGARETYDIYRGQLIVRNTVQFTGGPKQRRTVAYLVTTHEVIRGNWHRREHFDTFHIGEFASKSYAEKAIDRILDEGHDKAA